jgi:geranylgeranyl diphosphate/geranylgeranyl-bacteriochlorophyllide a reductase
MQRVAVIGGGPAGAHAACRLAAAGLPVTLFEPRTRFEKPCGGGIPARGLEAYPFLDDPGLPRRRVSRCVIIAPSGRETEIGLAEPLAILRRADLHAFLLDRATGAGTDLVRQRVVDFSRDRSRWTLTTRSGGVPREHGPFDFLIAADGAGGFARRRLTQAVPSADLTQGLGYHVADATEDAVTLRFYSGLDGYLWVFPRLDHASVGICGGLGRRPAADLYALVDRFVRERYGDDALARAERYAALIPGAPADPDGISVTGDGWALAGDCGQAVDPLTREGIYFAMLSADLLADALLRGRLEEYPAAWRTRMGHEFAWAARHAPAFFDPVFIERLVRLSRRSRSVRATLADLVSGRQSYRTLKRRLLLRAPIVAWQAIRRAAPAQDRLSAARGS